MEEDIIYSNIQTKVNCGYCSWDWDTTFERWNLAESNCLGSCQCQSAQCSSSCPTCSEACV